METSEDKRIPQQEGNPVPGSEQPEISNHVPAALEEDQDPLEAKIDENTASAVPAITLDHAAGSGQQHGGAMPRPPASDEGTDEQRTDVAQISETATGSPTSVRGFQVQPAIPDRPEQASLDVPTASPKEADREHNIATGTVAVVKEEPEKAEETQGEAPSPLLEPCLETKTSQDSLAPKIEVDAQEDSPEKQEISPQMPDKSVDKTDEAIEKDEGEQEDADEDTIPQVV